MLDRTFCLAPMMMITDRHFRYLSRLISQHTLLYTEMVTTGALIYGPRERLLQHDAFEYPTAMQLGGSNPDELATCSQLVEEAGFQEVNLNVGCPSDRVQNNRIGAVLMDDPDGVAECVSAMNQAVKIPVTVKCRIGIDDQDPHTQLPIFIEKVKASGCTTFIIHARMAWLQGLSPAQNRDVPPLDYDLVYQIKRDNPDLEIIINGGIKTIEECQSHLKQVDGVMLGRALDHNPWLMQEADAELFGLIDEGKTRKSVIQSFLPYVQAQCDQGVPLHAMSRHLLGMFRGKKGGANFRRHLSQEGYKKGVGAEVIVEALDLVEDC